MKKATLFCLVLILALMPTFSTSAAVVQRPATFEVKVMSAANTPLADAHVWSYEYDGGNAMLQSEGKTDSNGSLTIVNSPEAPSATGWRHYLLHVYDPNHGVLAHNWSQEATPEKLMQQEPHALTLVYETAKVRDTETQRLGSGIFRTEKVNTDTSVNPVSVAEIYHIPGSPLKVEATLTNSTTTKIESKMKLVWPSVAPGWNFSGDRIVTHTTGVTNTWSSNSIGIYDGMELLTRFNFVHETWELSEQDIDVYDLWHVRERWVEVKAHSLVGGSINGTPKSSSFNRRPYQNVIYDQYGIHIPIDTHNTHRMDALTSRSFTVGAQFPVQLPHGMSSDVSLASTSTYHNKAFTLFYDNSNNNKNVAIYDHFTNGEVWYATQQP